MTTLSTPCSFDTPPVRAPMKRRHAAAIDGSMVLSEMLLCRTIPAAVTLIVPAAYVIVTCFQLSPVNEVISAELKERSERVEPLVAPTVRSVTRDLSWYSEMAQANPAPARPAPSQPTAAL